MSRMVATVLAFAVVIGLAATVRAAGKAPAKKTLIYSGHLSDESGSALAGIYPLTFSLHKDEQAARKLWSEEHYVAVEDGVYTVELGKRRAIPRGLDTGSLYIAVSLTGGGEMVRERISERNQPEEPSLAAVSAAAPTRAVGGAAPAGTPQDYAEKAGFAYEAEHSRNSDRVGNLTIEQLDERYRAQGGARLGASRRYSGSIGGNGGRPYRIVCPKGYVAVGIRGGAGIYVDSLELICAPLE